MSDEFLDVKKSLSERAWFGPSKEQERIASGIVQEYDISSLSAVMLVKRGIKPNELTSFLSPKIRDLMPDPYILKDMEKASKRILEAVKKKQEICIFADYDVDGTTSASMLFLWLKHFEIIPEIYIPDRVKEGYGPNPVAMEILSKKKITSRIISVPCFELFMSQNKNYKKTIFGNSKVNISIEAGCSMGWNEVCPNNLIHASIEEFGAVVSSH